MLTRLHRAGAAAAATAAATWLATSPAPADTKSSKPIVLVRTSTETPGKPASKPALAPGVELLVHNISHADLICTVATQQNAVGKVLLVQFPGKIRPRPLSVDAVGTLQANTIIHAAICAASSAIHCSWVGGAVHVALHPA